MVAYPTTGHQYTQNGYALKCQMTGSSSNPSQKRSNLKAKSHVRVALHPDQPLLTEL